MANTAEEMTNLLATQTEILKNRNYILNDKAIIVELYNALKKIFKFFIQIKKFKKTIDVTSNFQIPSSLNTINSIMQSTIPIFDNAMQYVNYFANSEEVNDQTIINNAQLEADELTRIAEITDKINNLPNVVNNIVTEQTNNTENKINSIVSHNVSLQTSLSKLKTKLSNFL
jgi:hypothetical protein